MVQLKKNKSLKRKNHRGGAEAGVGTGSPSFPTMMEGNTSMPDFKKMGEMYGPPPPMPTMKGGNTNKKTKSRKSSKRHSRSKKTRKNMRKMRR